MSLQFIFGNSGSGKSHHLYQRVIEESIKHPEKNYIILVPEQFTMQTQQDLVRQHPNKGIMNIDVLSFGRLAFRVLEEVGGMQQIILDDEGKSLVLRKIAGDCEGDLKVLRGNLKKIGYINEVKSVISEFTQYDIKDEDIDKIVANAGENSYLAYKLRDIQKVYDQFNAYLEGKYITKEEVLDVLCMAVKDSEMLADSVVALDGFTGFTPIQNRVMGELMKKCAQVLVTVTMDQREDPYVLKHKYQLFAISKQMVTGLVEIAGDNRILIEEPVYLYERPVYRFRANAELDFLEKSLFRPWQEGYKGPVESLSFHCCRNPRAEIDFTAREILHLIRNKGYRYQDIAVVTNDISIYGNCVEEIFDMYEIPFFMDQKRSILLNSFVEYVRSLLAMIEGGFLRDGVFRYLRTGLAGLSSDDVDILENYVIAMGIKGYRRWQEKWIRRTSNITAVDLELINSMRNAFVSQMKEVVTVLKKRNKTVKDITQALYEFFVRENIQQQLKEQELIFQNSGDQALAREYSQIFRIVIELFDKFAELLGDEKVTLKEYCELLDSGFEEAKVGIIPPEVDQVTIGDIERTRLNEIKALFFVGVNDTLLPGNLMRGSFLSERDREQFAECKVALSPVSKEQVYIQKFYIYMNVTKPTEHLYLSFAKASLEGAALRPAYLVNEIKKLYPDIIIRDEENTGIGEKELTPRSAVSFLVGELHDKSKSLSSEWKELYGWYRRNPLWRERIWRLVEASFYTRPDDSLSERVARELYGDENAPGVTRMERFSACAYAHFLSYGLKLRKREEYEFEAVDMGNVFHSAIEHFSRKLESEGYNWAEIPAAKCEQFIEESVEESIVDYGNTVLYSTARNQYMITRMKRIMRRTVWTLSRQLEKGDFQPSGYEIVFPGGKIDRVDTCTKENKVYVKVIDYKTGAKSFDLVALYHGLQMQLVVYMNAALAMEEKRNPAKEVVPAGIFYYKMKDPIVNWEENDEKLEQAILKELRLDGVVNSEEEILSHLERDLTGHSLILPVGKNKDGSLAKASKALSTEGFKTISAFTRQKAAEINEQILTGQISVSPYEMGSDTGCDYCSYRDICGFDKNISGYRYRRLSRFDQEELLERMEKEV